MQATLEGRIALVTGGGSGIGLAIAQSLAASGARVMICDISEEAVECASAGSERILGFSGDAADPATVEAAFSRLEAHWGSADILVNNVGIGGPTAWVEDTLKAEWDETLRINLGAAFLCTRRAVPAMKRTRSGRIVNISSVAGRLGFPLRLSYSATKWGLIGMTKTLAMELGPFGVSVNAILPGLVSNPRADGIMASQAEVQGKSPDAILAQFLSRISMRTRVTLEEIAATANFLCSNEGRHISGQSISVCGNFETYANPTP